MTTIAQFLRQTLRNQHNLLDQAVGDLTLEQLHWVPPGTNANHIGFTLWHYVRTEDNIVQFILQDRKPTIWVEGSYHEKWGLERTVRVMPFGEIPARQALGMVVLTHGHGHLGEICVLRVLQGLPSSLI